MRRIILSLLAVVVIAGLFAATGYAGYRLGFAQGAQATVNGDEIPRPGLRPFDDFGPRGMPGRDFGFDREFHRGFGMRGFPMRGFGFFSPLMFLGWMVVLGLIGWFLYWLFARSGWRLTRTTQTAVSQGQPVETKVTEIQEEKTQSED